MPKFLRDSKMLSEARREAVFEEVADWCTAWSVGHADPRECDELGMTAAQGLAASRALISLDSGVSPTALLLDGPFDYIGKVRSGGGPPVTTVVGGDGVCASIAAASILAKVTRDRILRSWSESYPGFDFHRNKGYPSETHKTALRGYGLTSAHRRSWSFAGQIPWGSGQPGNPAR